MKKRNYLLILAAVFVAILVVPSVFISCSDDDDITVSIEEDVVTNGITAEMTEGIYIIDVKSNGRWVASLPNECSWATLITEEGYGDKQLVIVLDGNYTGISRSTIITISSSENTTNVTLRQNETMNGQPAENGEDYVKLTFSKNLGFGCNAMEFYDDPTKNRLKFSSNNVVNLTSIENVMKTNEDYSTENLLVISPRQEVVYESSAMDSIVDKQDSLGVKLELEVSYGLWKFGLGGKFVSSESVK